MAPARIRTVTVGGRQYLQVVETQPGGSISILGSFGEASNVENVLKANHFAASYNQLRDLAQTRQQNNDEFFRAALAIFGVVLGAAIIASLLGED